MPDTLQNNALGSAQLRADNRIRLAILLLGVWLHAANSMLAATTLPSSVREFGGGQLIGWAFSLYLLGSILAGAGSAVLARRFSLTNCLTAGAVVYLFGCIVCALAADMIIVLLGRLLQGLGGGLIIAITFVGLNRWFDSQQLPRLMAMVSAVWSMSAFCGPLVGGTFATFGHWRWAFWAFALQAGLFIVASRLLMPKEHCRLPVNNASVPYSRLLVLTLAILSVAMAGVVDGALQSVALCGIGVFLLWMVFKLDANNAHNRMFPSKPINPSFTVGAGLLFVLLASIATMSFLVYGPILLETLHSVSPLTAGYIVALESMAWGAGAVAVANALDKIQPLLIRTGSVLITAGTMGFALTMSSGPIWLILICASIQGLAFGISWAFIVKRITAAATEAEKDVAASSIPTLQQIGFAIGAAAASIVASLAGFGEQLTLASAESASKWIFTAFVPIAVLATAAAWKMTALPFEAKNQ